jgi:hypothetical protein
VAALENPRSLIEPGTRGKATSDRAAAKRPVTPARLKNPVASSKKYGLMRTIGESGWHDPSHAARSSPMLSG